MAATSQQSISSTTPVSLGAAPVMVQCLGPGPVIIIVAASGSPPAAGAVGYLLRPENPPTIFQPNADTTPNVYAAMYNSEAALIASTLVLSTATI